MQIVIYRDFISNELLLYAYAVFTWQLFYIGLTLCEIRYTLPLQFPFFDLLKVLW